MTREELKEHCKKTVEQCEMWAIYRGEEPSGKVYEEHKLILDILEQEPCDTISRERVLAPYKDLNDDDAISVWLIKKNITELPPIAPSRPKGHWIHLRCDMYECSECGKIHTSFEIGKCDADYCPKCGAEMESEE